MKKLKTDWADEADASDKATALLGVRGWCDAPGQVQRLAGISIRLGASTPSTRRSNKKPYPQHPANPEESVIDSS
jgi:hypothetical protein